MITAEEITIKHPHFRLKVDLSKFFHDARQFCWIFIDGTKIQQVIHVEQHIGKLFNIAKPFHLLLNDEYLPPTEDVRILKENETILVIPGSGIDNEITVETCNNSAQDKEIQKMDVQTAIVAYNTLDTSNNTLSDKQPTSISNITKDMTFYSVINDTVIDDTEGDTDSKVTDNNLTDCNVANSVISKKKRVRKRRPKNRSQLVSPSDINEKDKPKKPKIIDSYIISSRGKHIRFDDIENDKNNTEKQIAPEPTEPHSIKTSYRDLSTLLALGQTSTPLTFMNKKIKCEAKMENILNDEIRSKNLCDKVKNLSDKVMMNNTVEKSLCNKEANKTTQSYKNLHVDPEKVPIMTRKPQIKDIIAFKTLKIGADYTPQESNFILTEVVDLCAKSANYTLKILDGKEEIQVPFGKLCLSEDESASQHDADTFLLNYSQMREPRLISQSFVL